MLNVLDEDGKKEYLKKTFTSEGVKILNTYLKQLIMWDWEKIKLPMTQGIILGLPQLLFAQIIENHDELVGRIKLLAQILGIDEYTIITDSGSVITYSMKELKEVKK